MKLNFSGRTALITGGSGGIGLSIVKKLIKNKIKVIILDINTPSKKILLNKYVEFIKTDLSDYKNLQLCLTELKRKYKKIEYVINAAGVLWFDKDVSLEKIEINTWDKVFSINLNSIVIVLQSMLPQMKKHRIAIETRDIYIPLAHRMGMCAVKSQLEDLVFQVLKKEITRKLGAELNLVINKD